MAFGFRKQVFFTRVQNKTRPMFPIQEAGPRNSSCDRRSCLLTRILLLRLLRLILLCLTFLGAVLTSGLSHRRFCERGLNLHRRGLNNWLLLWRNRSRQLSLPGEFRTVENIITLNESRNCGSFRNRDVLAMHEQEERRGWPHDEARGHDSSGHSASVTASFGATSAQIARFRPDSAAIVPRLFLTRIT
jgi:hypothetical protein